MKNLRNVALTATVLTVTTFGAGSLLAQDKGQQEAQIGNGMHDNMMEGGGMHDNMMGMMAQMQPMMAKCNAMMTAMQEAQKTDTGN
ncbi:hypothetical protein [Halomonas sp. WWR20]